MRQETLLLILKLSQMHQCRHIIHWYHLGFDKLLP